MTDRGLLKRAARAAGIDGHFENNGEDAGLFIYDPEHPSIWKRWNPLCDDGDALRLAVKLMLPIVFGANYVIVDGDQSPTVNNANDPCAATRRAIVRAAAALAT